MEKKEMKRCPYCGEMILAAAKKCKECGEWLENSEAIIADDKEEKLATVVPKSKSKPVAEPCLLYTSIKTLITQTGNNASTINNTFLVNGEFQFY